MKIIKKINAIYKNNENGVSIGKDVIKTLTKFFSFAAFGKLALLTVAWEIYRKAEINLQKQYRARKTENKKSYKLQADFYAFLLFAIGFGLIITDFFKV